MTYCIPSYNHINYVKKAIDSILNQTYENIELIVIDDCSTDGSDLFLERYSREKGFKYIKNDENIGPVRTTSKLLNMADGEYVCVLASDDYIDPKKVELQMKYLEENQWSIDVLYGPVIEVDENGKEICVIKQREENLVIEAENALIDFYETGKGLGLLQSGIMKTDVARNVYYLEGYKSDDFLFYVRLLQNGYTVGHYATPLTYYRLHENNSHKDPDYCLFELEIPVVRDFFPKKYRNKYLARAWLMASVKWFRQKRYIKSFIYFMKSLWLDFNVDSMYYYLCELIGTRWVDFKKRIGLENVTLIKTKRK